MLLSLFGFFSQFFLAFFFCFSSFLFSSVSVPAMPTVKPQRIEVINKTKEKIKLYIHLDSKTNPLMIKELEPGDGKPVYVDITGANRLRGIVAESQFDHSGVTWKALRKHGMPQTVVISRDWVDLTETTYHDSLVDGNNIIKAKSFKEELRKLKKIKEEHKLKFRDKRFLMPIDRNIKSKKTFTLAQFLANVPKEKAKIYVLNMQVKKQEAILGPSKVVTRSDGRSIATADLKTRGYEEIDLTDESSYVHQIDKILILENRLDTYATLHTIWRDEFGVSRVLSFRLEGGATVFKRLPSISPARKKLPSSGMAALVGTYVKLNAGTYGFLASPVSALYDLESFKTKKKSKRLKKLNSALRAEYRRLFQFDTVLFVIDKAKAKKKKKSKSKSYKKKKKKAPAKYQLGHLAIQDDAKLKKVRLRIYIARKLDAEKIYNRKKISKMKRAGTYRRDLHTLMRNRIDSAPVGNISPVSRGKSAINTR